MKKSVMKKWVKALRSGKYKQCRWQLKDGDKYCCLGVLCDISKLSKFDGTGGYLDEELELPDDVLEYAHMRDSVGKFIAKNNRETSLSTLNDDRQYSFKKIADYIEKYWEQL